jgi:hypothetical protein
LILLRNLRFAGSWLIALMCLALLIPTACMAAPSKEEPAKQFELLAQNFGAELLDSPVEPTGIGKHATQCPKTATIASKLVLTGQLPPGEAGFLQFASTSPWLVRCHSLFLPRPPPHS